MTQIIMQVLASIVIFGIAYSGVMAALPPNSGYLKWGALLAGLTAVASYHGGLFQETPTAPSTTVASTTEKVEVTQTPKAPEIPKVEAAAEPIVKP